MFCIKCGSELAEETNFCSKCGAPQGEQERKRFQLNKKALIAVLIVAVVVIAFLIHAGNNINASPEKLAIAVVEAMYEVDPKKMVQTYPDYVIRKNAYVYDLNENATRAQIVNAMKASIAQSNVQPQEVKILSCEITGRLAIEDLLWDYYGMTRAEYNTITDTAIVEIECLVDGQQTWREVSCIEMDGKWYMLDMD